MTIGECHPSNAGSVVPRSPRLPLAAFAAALVLGRTAGAGAFPLLDASSPDQVPQGTELSTPDVHDLQHQLQLVNGLTAPLGGGWTIIPRIDWQEELTDNVQQLNSPRQSDLVTYISPGIGIAGDLPRLQLTFDFAPTLSIYTRTGDLNSLTEQMNGLGTVTLVPDLAYVDVRAVAGVHNQYGGLGGLGALGVPAGSAATPQSAIPVLAGNTLGLNKSNEVQTTSFGVSPYLLRRFGEWGTGKLGYSVDATKSNTLSGFAASPFPSGGDNAQTLISQEEIAHFQTGEFMEYLQDAFDIDLQQTQTTSGAGVIDFRTGLPLQSEQNSSSTRALVTDQITYQVNRVVAVFASGGHEDITYTGIGAQSIHDLTWSLGTTLTPNVDSSLTVSYGHLNGDTSLSADGHYALTARTMLTLSYGTSLGTQLQYVQNQLNLATAGSNGTLVNGQTGGGLFGATNALGVEDGVFRTTTLTVGSQTTLDRDIISVTFQSAKQTNTGTNVNASSNETKSAGVSWLHQMRPDMTASAAISYAVQDQSNGFVSAFNPGNNTSIAMTLAWQWQISDTVSTSVRYSFFERQSAVTIYDMYQNMLILGISKRF
ncbi:MAG TPA: hypothetical protein VGC09_13050 [Rhodopila sp.]